jgi:hypothetical protein
MIVETITQTNPDLGREQLDEPHFDSHLKVTCCNGMTNAELKVVLKILFVPVKPGDPGVEPDYGSHWIKDADENWHIIAPWAAGEFDLWATQALKQVNAYWNGNKGNGQLWLKTPDYVSALDWPTAKPTHRPNVWCRFQAQRVYSAAEAHIKVRVVRLPVQQDNPLYFRSRMTLWDSADLMSVSFASAGSNRRFYTAVHEVGHCIGQRHVGEVQSLPSCTMMSQANGCYGSYSDHAVNVMGLGDRIQPANAITWQKRIVRHFPQDPSCWEDWAASTTRIYPRMLSKVAQYDYEPAYSGDWW